MTVRVHRRACLQRVCFREVDRKVGDIMNDQFFEATVRGFEFQFFFLEKENRVA